MNGKLKTRKDKMREKNIEAIKMWIQLKSNQFLINFQYISKPEIQKKILSKITEKRSNNVEPKKL